MKGCAVSVLTVGMLAVSALGMSVCANAANDTVSAAYPAAAAHTMAAVHNVAAAHTTAAVHTVAAAHTATAAAASTDLASVPGRGYMARSLHHPVPGGVAVVPLGATGGAPLVHYEAKPVMVVKDSDSQWVAIVGIDLKSVPGRHIVQVKQDGATHQVAFQVGHKDYASQHITLKNRAHVSPDPEQLKRYEREHAEQMRAYAQYRPAGPSNVLLDAPVQGRTSSPFGLRRFFNGEERNPHSGLDFAVGRGTPIKVPADGVVTVVGDYFFNGRTVFVDHGQGFITMYCHLDGIDVKLGQELKRGEVLGRVGATGRATGPHLHWNVSLNGNRVDPAIFLKK